MSDLDVSCLRNTHLKDRFLNLLNRIEKDGPSNVLFMSRFKSIQTEILCSRYFWFDIKSVDSISDALEDLIDALLDCRALAYHRDAPLKISQPAGLLNRNIKSVELFNMTVKTRLDKSVKCFKSEREQFQINSNWRVADSSNQDTDASEIIGFGKIARQIENKLIPNKDGFKAIAIVGSGGSGKTALARKLFASMKEKFDSCIWVCLSGISLWEQNVVQLMLKELKFDYDAMTTEFDIVDFLKELEKLLKGKSYLVVLDNLQEMKDWYRDLCFELPDGETFKNRLSHALPKGSGGTVIVTTRLEKEAENIVGSRNVIRLDSVPEDLCWSIFMTNLEEGKRIVSNELVEQMKNDIIENCGGLPLVAKALAEIISSKLPASK